MPDLVQDVLSVAVYGNLTSLSAQTTFGSIML